MAVISGSELKSSNTKRSVKKRKQKTGPDAVDGKSCHQCRQKTTAFVVGCKNKQKDKLCGINICHKCLSNRYGENAMELSLLEDWKCPKCRGICNCSLCMKKRGFPPTGQLVSTAKATGYSSVSDMLQFTGIENIDQIKVLKDKSGSRKKIKVSNNEEIIVSSENSEKETCIEEMTGINVNSSALSKSPSDKQSAGCKKKKASVKPEGTLSKDNVVNELDGPNDGENQPKKLMQGQPKSEFDSKRGDSESVEETLSEESQDFRKNKEKRSLKEGSLKDNIIENNDPFALTPLPQGTAVTAIGDTDLQQGDVGNALQFLEFCMVFGKILDINKGQAEAVLRDILQGRSTRRGKCSVTIQFLSSLLSFLKEEEEEKSSAETLIEGKNSCYADIKMLILKSPSVARTMRLDSLSNDVEEFEYLNPSEKLKMLTFICDEVLGTVKIRDWIDDQNSNFAEKAKEAKEKVVAAKNEEKRLKEKMQNEIAQAIIAKNGALLSLSEHEAIFSEIKRELAEAHVSLVESKNTYSKCNKRSEAVRTEPFFSGTDGKVYWTLKCYGDKSVLLCQDVGTGDIAGSDEKWSAFDAEQKEIIEKHINSLRVKRRVRTPKVQKKLQSQENEATPQDLTDITGTSMEECNEELMNGLLT
ncbi:uncharacterized protein [Solanum lycopersicum]|uniref:uncharacterized protein isoform X2 n=1 Tax=Solanum lycopersicum TaxID=4081 RepID=UPI00374A04EF